MSTQPRVLDHARDFGVLAVLTVLILSFMLISPDGFAQPANLINVVQQTAVNGIIAAGIMFVIISGGIDLSSGSTVALAGVVAATAAGPQGMPLPMVVLAALTAGAAVGLVNGIGVAYLGLPAFIATLASMTGIRGLALIISSGSPVPGLPAHVEDITSSLVAGMLPLPALYFIVIMLSSGFVLNRTVFGRRLYSIGGNTEAAVYAGIRTKRYLLGTYTIAGILAGFAGLLLTSQTMQGSPTAGQGYEFDAIAAVVLGGISVGGGSGKWHGVVSGALLIAVISNGLDFLGIGSDHQTVLKAIIVAGAVYFDQRNTRPIST